MIDTVYKLVDVGPTLTIFNASRIKKEHIETIQVLRLEPNIVDPDINRVVDIPIARMFNRGMVSIERQSMEVFRALL